MDPVGQLLVDREDLLDLGVLSVGGLRAGVFQEQALLVDPLVRGFLVGTSFWTPTTKMTLAVPEPVRKAQRETTRVIPTGE